MSQLLCAVFIGGGTVARVFALVARHEAQSCAPCYPDWDSNGQPVGSAFVIAARLAWI